MTKKSVGVWFKFLFKRIIKYMTNADNIKFFIVRWGSILFGLPTNELSAAWDILWKLVQDAANAFPGSGQGESKYEFVLKKILAEMPDLAVHVVDFLLHTLLPAAEKSGVTT